MRRGSLEQLLRTDAAEALAYSRKNPVLLLQFILELDTVNLQMFVKPPSHPTANYVNIRTGPSRRADPYPTSGTEGNEQVAMPMVDASALKARAATSDTVIEANRIAYEQSRVGGVTGSAYKWCAAAGITEEELQDRHNNHSAISVASTSATEVSSSTPSGTAPNA